MSAPLNGEIAAAIGQFFFRGDGPSHSALTQAFAAAGLSEHDPYNPVTQTPNKQQRVISVSRAGARRTSSARKLTEELLDALRLHGSFNSADDGQRIDGLRSALKHAGWELSADGRLEQLGKIDLETGGRLALNEQLDRLRRNIDDPAALLGGAKELIEAIAKFVLEEGGLPPDPRIPFPGLIDLSFERLALLPAVVSESAEGTKQIREIYRSAKKTVVAVNELRNLQGTGHGRTLPTGVTTEAARYVIREATHVAELMLTTHDRQMGR
jgi:hypothetical protein